MADGATQPIEPTNPAPPTPPNEPGKVGPDGTVLTTPNEPPATPAIEWRDDWRDAMAGDDTKLRKQLDRFTTPGDLAKAFQETRQKVSEGVKPLERPGEGAEEAVVNAYREANGIPAEAKGYLDDLPDGLVIGEDDMPIAEDFLSKAHESHMSRADAHAALQWYYGVQEQMAQKSAEADAEYQRDAQQALIQKWGGDYKLNVDAARQFMDSGPTDAEGRTMTELLLEARLPDGRKLQDNAAFMQWAAHMSRQADPVAFVTPAGGNNVETVQARIAEIDKMMGDRNSDYWKGPQAEALQKEYRDLVSALERAKDK